MYTDGFAKFSIRVNLDSDLLTINRKTDSLFDWLGEWGGLLDGLHLCAELLVHFYSVYAIRIRLVYLLVRFLPSSEVYRRTKGSKVQFKKK